MLISAYDMVIRCSHGEQARRPVTLTKCHKQEGKWFAMEGKNLLKFRNKIS
jgi:hypothetical protein